MRDAQKKETKQPCVLCSCGRQLVNVGGSIRQASIMFRLLIRDKLRKLRWSIEHPIHLPAPEVCRDFRHSVFKPESRPAVSCDSITRWNPLETSLISLVSRLKYHRMHRFSPLSAGFEFARSILARWLLRVFDLSNLSIDGALKIDPKGDG